LEFKTVCGEVTNRWHFVFSGAKNVSVNNVHHSFKTEATYGGEWLCILPRSFHILRNEFAEMIHGTQTAFRKAKLLQAPHDGFSHVGGNLK
jgi:hypothetical protein